MEGQGQDPLLYHRDFDRLQEARPCVRVPPDEHPLPFPPCPISCLSHMQDGGGFQSDSLERNVAQLLWAPVQQGTEGIQNATFQGVQEGLCL